MAADLLQWPSTPAGRKHDTALSEEGSTKQSTLAISSKAFAKIIAAIKKISGRQQRPKVSVCSLLVAGGTSYVQVGTLHPSCEGVPAISAHT
jgi:hypothetical protein